MEPSYDIRLKMQNIRLSTPGDFVGNQTPTHNKENAMPLGVENKAPIRVGRGRGLIAIRKHKEAQRIRKSLI